MMNLLTISDRSNRIVGSVSAPLGGKADGLAKLEAAGFAVPPWFVVTPDAYDADLDGSPVADALAALGGETFAVRSSAVGEDGTAASFAGQFATYLNVPATEVAARIRDVRASADRPNVASYRAGTGAAETRDVCVVVQRMVAADAAGVAFSRDPVNGDDTTIVCAVAGLGEALVSGEESGETSRVERDGTIRRVGGAAHGVLDDPGVRAVADAARRAESALAGPQDIEWAMEAGALYLLQARPITALAPRAERIVWDNANIAESYGGLVSPLTFSFARYGYATAYRQMLRILKVDAAAIARHDDTLANLLGLVSGRMYYHIANWYRLLALLPGFRINRAFMEQMMGLEEGLPPDVLAEIAAAGGRGRLRDALASARTLFALAAEQRSLARRVAAFHAWFGATLDAARDPETLAAEELETEFCAIASRLATRWDVPLVNDFLTMVWFGVLRALCKSWCGDTDGTLQNELVAGGAAMVSVEPARAIEAMAALARCEPVLLDALGRASRADVEAADAPVFHDALARYVDRFGDRCESELKLESITLRDDPAPLYRAIARAAAMGPALEAPGATGSGAGAGRARGEERVARALTNPIARAIFRRVLANARACIVNREEMRLERTRLFGRVRRIFRACGARLAATGQLAHADDVFRLEMNDVFAALRDGTDRRAAAAASAAEYARYALRPSPPNRVITESGRIIAGAAATAVPDSAGDAERRSGIGCCAGIVRGTVQLVRDPNADFAAGRILVTERTDPSWVMLFPAAAGILVERGSLLSHAAIVSRELGIPSVVGIAGLTTWLQTGDEVEFDGAAGTIVRLVAAARA